MESVAVLALLALGALHGLNPGMGWLFAVGLGLQERSRRAVWSALAPLALGHAVAVGVAVVVAATLGGVIPREALRWLVAGALVSFGCWRLLRPSHGVYGGMRVGFRDLTVWSLLMGSAHGAGLMVVPVLLGSGAGSAGAAGVHAPDAHAAHGALAAGVTTEWGLAATLLHAAAYLVVTGTIAVLVYEKLGLRLLRRTWVNLDQLWAIALILTGGATAVL